MASQDSKPKPQLAEVAPGCNLVHFDAVRWLTARADKARPNTPRPIKLAVCDPPYNYGQQYAGYSDKLSRAKYLDWTRAWLKAVADSLADDGSLWVFVPDEWAGRVQVYCEDSLDLTLRNWVVWAFTFGQKATNKFTRSKCHVLYFVKDKNDFTFNERAVAVPSARQLVYKDKRAAGLKPPDDVWMLLSGQLEPYMTPDRDVWLQSRVCGTFKERMPHSPNQLPLPLVERIVLACSNPGDLVLDPFGGSFTTGVACVRHGRRFLGIDVSQTCVDAGKARIKEEMLRLKADL